MKYRRKIWGLFIIILLGIIGGVLIKNSDKSKDWIYCDFPSLDDTVIEEIRQGHHTDYFDETSVVHNFVEYLYDQEFAEINPVNMNEDKAIYEVVISNEAEGEVLRIELERQRVTTEDDYKIWKVIRYKIVE